MTTCPRCAAPVAADAWFCSRCGLDLAAARADRAAAPQAPRAGAGGPRADAAPVQRPPATPRCRRDGRNPIPRGRRRPRGTCRAPSMSSGTPAGRAAPPGPRRGRRRCRCRCPRRPRRSGSRPVPQPPATARADRVQPPAWAAVQRRAAVRRLAPGGPAAARSTLRAGRPSWRSPPRSRPPRAHLRGAAAHRGRRPGSTDFDYDRVDTHQRRRSAALARGRGGLPGVVLPGHRRVRVADRPDAPAWARWPSSAGGSCRWRTS